MRWEGDRSRHLCHLHPGCPMHLPTVKGTGRVGIITLGLSQTHQAQCWPHNCGAGAPGWCHGRGEPQDALGAEAAWKGIVCGRAGLWILKPQLLNSGRVLNVFLAFTCTGNCPGSCLKSWKPWVSPSVGWVSPGGWMGPGYHNQCQGCESPSSYSSLEALGKLQTLTQSVIFLY